MSFRFKKKGEALIYFICLILIIVTISLFRKKKKNKSTYNMRENSHYPNQNSITDYIGTGSYDPHSFNSSSPRDLGDTAPEKAINDFHNNFGHDFMSGLGNSFDIDA